jgi:chromosomal replication initiation ATPase DnaA
MAVCSTCRQTILVSEKFLTAEDILQKLCEYYKVNYLTLIKKNRTRNMVEIRMISAHVLFNDCTLGMTLSSIGKLLGDKHHTSIIHMLKKCKNFYEIYPDFQDKLKNVHQFVYGHTLNVKF